MANNPKDKDDKQSAQNFDVGFGKPPKNFQFKKGESGNPKGRPKGSKNIRTLLNQELDAQLIIQEHGVNKSISKREAIIKRLVAESLKGNLRAQDLLFKQIGIEAEKVDIDLKSMGLDDQVLQNYNERQYDRFKLYNTPEPDDKDNGGQESHGGEDDER